MVYRRPRWPRLGRRRLGPGFGPPRTATGTEITFLPSRETFTNTDFDFTTLEHRLRELAFLNSGVTLMLSDLRGSSRNPLALHFEGGLEAFARYLDRSKQVLHAPPIAIRGERDDILLRNRDGVDRQLHETMLASPTTSRSATAARIWPVSARR